MSKYRSVEEYAAHVKQVTSPLLGVMCAKFGPGHRYTLAVLDLLTESNEIVNGAQMTAEVAGGYDLAALVVQADVASISETGWERAEE